MADLDFDGLRADIEAATMLPGFDQVARRARRLKARGRLATLGAVLAVLAVLGPAGLLAARDRPAQLGLTSGPDATTTPVQIGLPAVPTRAAGSPSPSPAPHASIVAAAGADLDYVYALIDVCQINSCNLQLSRIVTGQGAGGASPAKVGLLRKQPTDYLGQFQLTALSDTSVVVSALNSSGVRQYQRIELGRVADDPGTGSNGTLAKDGNRIGVLDNSGTLQALDDKTGQLRTVPEQPPLRQLTVAGAVAPAKGLWVIGNSAVTGDVGVAVSQNAGASWTTVGLPVAAGSVPPVLASYDGHTAYLLVQTTDREFALFQTTDGGSSWHRLSTTLPWPAPSDTPTGYGLVVRPDGSLLAWLGTSPATVYAQSTDGGRHYANVAGPGGPVIAVADGYVCLAGAPKLSNDGFTWANAVLPYLPVSD
jgi:hypothetical protein